MRFLIHSAGAGHHIRGKYRVYGEGSVHHSGNPCEHGLGLDRHPLIFRHDWDSRWAYWRDLIANEYEHRRMRRAIFPSGVTRAPVNSLVFHWSPFDWPMRKLFGPPYRRVPSVEAALLPKDSIYDRSDM